MCYTNLFLKRVYRFGFRNEKNQKIKNNKYLIIYVILMTECSTCMEVRKGIPCPCEQCDWAMCRTCGNKWYMYKTRCPACRNENHAYLEIMEKENRCNDIKTYACIFVIYTSCLIALFLMGRVVSIVIRVGPLDFFCNGSVWWFVQTSLFGAMVVTISICCGVILSAFLSFLWNGIRCSRCFSD